MNESAKCSKCGREVDTTVSFSAPGREPTPPLCKKCFDELLRNLPRIAARIDRETGDTS